MKLAHLLNEKLEHMFDIFDRKKNVVSGLLILGVILILEGSIFIYSTLNGWFSHIPLSILFILLFAGFADIGLIILYRYKRSKGEKSRMMERNKEMAPYLEKLDRYFHISNRYVSIGIGSAIIFFAWFHNIIGIGGTAKIGDTDVLIFLTGFSLILYSFIPAEYHLERDFTLTFLVFLVFLMGIIPSLFDEFSGFKYYFLTRPLHEVLKSIGIQSKILGRSTISFRTVTKGPITLVIAKSCSGIYSFSIFTSAFIAFVLVVYRKLDRKSIIFLVLGIFLAYIGNILRMTIVVVSGYYYGVKTMMWVHGNVGYIIFFIWMGLFWFLLYKFLMKEPEEPKNKDEK